MNHLTPELHRIHKGAELTRTIVICGLAIVAACLMLPGEW